MELMEAIKTRRSIRVFSDKKLEKDVLEKIIEAGNYAPSHCNMQGWKFIFIDNQDIKNKIFENGGSHVIKNASYGILVVYNKALVDNTAYQDWIQSGAAAMQNMLLVLHSLGLGGCWICHLPRKKILNKMLNIQKPYSPVAYLAFGYPKATPIEVKRKKEIKEVYAINKFVWPGEKTPLKIYLKRIARKIYYIMPLFIKKMIFPIVDKFVKKFRN
ncbi:MAG: nitroreductase family protein [Patescibacteria group bacterium]